MKLFRYPTTPIAFLLWIACIWFLQKEVISQSFLTKDAYIDINNGALILRQDFLGLYLGNKKIGFTQFILKEDSDESLSNLPGKYYLFQSRMLLQIEAMGMMVAVRTTQSGEVNEDLSLRAFNFTFEGSGQNLAVIVQVESDGLHVTTRSEGESTETVIPTQLPIYHTDMIHLVLARNGLEVGKTTTFPVFDAATMSKGDVTAKVVDREEISLPNGETVKAYKVDTSFKGIGSTSWINEDGDVFKEISQISGIRFTALRESKENAANMNFVSEEIKQEDIPDTDTDLINASKIVSPFPVKNPEKVSSMTLRLIGAEKSDLVLDFPLQTFISEESNGVVIKTKQLNYDSIIQSLPEAKPPYTADPALQPYLQDEALVQASHPKIKEKALEITASATSQWAAAEAIAKWLYKNITKQMRVTIPSAVEVLNSMKGDCNEHSTLFAALARSVGIPAKICAGLVYQDDGFYYHAWNEVYIQGTWLPVDATLNRIKMDAAHIKLAEGSLDSQTEIVNLIGNLDIDILNIEYND